MLCQGEILDKSTGHCPTARTQYLQDLTVTTFLDNLLANCNKKIFNSKIVISKTMSFSVKTLPAFQENKSEEGD